MVDKRLGVIGIFFENREQLAPEVNRILGEFSSLILGRLGLPLQQEKLCVISCILHATTDQVGAVTGKLGMLKGVKVKSFMA